MPAIAAVVAAVLGAGYFVVTGLADRGKPDTALTAERLVISSALSLSTAKTQDEYAITWNATAAGVANARVGVLSIHDGATNREIPLSKSQLEAGKLAYSPQSERFDVALEVFSPAGERLRESMIVTVPAQLLPPEVIRPAEGTPTVPRKREISPDRVRTFVPPSVAPRRPVPDAVLLAEAPSLQIAQATSRPITAGAPPVSLPLVTKPPAPQPPQPLRRVSPSIPPNVAALIRTPTNIRVRVQIDARGNVIRADALNGSNTGVNGFLTKSAVDAARLWSFTPARQGSAAVPGELVLSFAFGSAR